MKKLIFIISFLLLTTNAFAYTNRFDLASDCYKNPFLLSEWIQYNITYKSDYEVHKVDDYWQTPEETLLLKSGDCDDFSILADSILKLWGYESHIICMFDGKDFAHAICVFKYNNKWYEMGVEEINELNADCYWRIPLLLFEEHKLIYIWEANEKGDVLTELGKKE